MSSESRSSADLLLNFLLKNGIDQFVNVPTRELGDAGEGNILDLFMTNISEIVLDIKSEKIMPSDHNMVTVSLGCNLACDPSHDPVKDRSEA